MPTWSRTGAYPNYAGCADKRGNVDGQDAAIITEKEVMHTKELLLAQKQSRQRLLRDMGLSDDDAAEDLPAQQLITAKAALLKKLTTLDEFRSRLHLYHCSS